MTTTQRPRPQRPTPPAPDPASRGLILVVVAVVLGAILLVKGGGIGFEQDGEELTIDAGDTPAAESSTTTTTAAPATSVAPATLKVVALNGAGINGYAASAQQVLSVAGYTSTTAATAMTQTPTTIVYYAPGYEADAFAIAELLGLDAGAVQPLPQGTQLARDPAELPADTNVVVLLGPDVQDRLEGSGSTTTTVAGSSGSSDSTTTTTTG